MRHERLSRQRSSQQLRQLESSTGTESAPPPSLAAYAASGVSRQPPRRTFSSASLRTAQATAGAEQAGAAALSASQLGGVGGASPGAASTTSPKPAPQLFSKFPGLWRASRKWGASVLAEAAPRATGSTASGEGPAEPLAPAPSSQSFTAGYTRRVGTAAVQPQSNAPQALPVRHGGDEVATAGTAIKSGASPPITGQARLLRFSPRPLQQAAAPQLSPSSDAGAHEGGPGAAASCPASIGAPQRQPDALQQWQEWRRVASSLSPVPPEGARDSYAGEIGDGETQRAGRGADGWAGNAPGIGPLAMPLWLSSSGGSVRFGGQPADATDSEWCAAAFPSIAEPHWSSSVGFGPAAEVGAAGRGGGRAPPGRTPSFTVARGVAQFARSSSSQRRMQAMSTGQLLLPSDFEPQVAAAAAEAAALFAATSAGDGAGLDGLSAAAVDSPSRGGARALPGRTPGCSMSFDGRLAPGWEPGMFGPAAAPPPGAGPCRLAPQPPQVTQPQQPVSPLLLRQQSRGAMRPSGRASLELAPRPQVLGGPAPPSRNSLDSQRPGTGRFAFEARGTAAVPQRQPSEQAQGQQASACTQPPSPQHERRQPPARQESFSLPGPGQGQAGAASARGLPMMVTNSFKAQRAEPVYWQEAPQGLLPC